MSKVGEGEVLLYHKISYNFLCGRGIPGKNVYNISKLGSDFEIEFELFPEIYTYDAVSEDTHKKVFLFSGRTT